MAVPLRADGPLVQATSAKESTNTNGMRLFIGENTSSPTICQVGVPPVVLFQRAGFDTGRFELPTFS